MQIVRIRDLELEFAAILTANVSGIEASKWATECAALEHHHAILFCRPLVAVPLSVPSNERCSLCRSLGSAEGAYRWSVESPKFYLFFILTTESTHLKRTGFGSRKSTNLI